MTQRYIKKLAKVWARVNSRSLIQIHLPDQLICW